MSVAHLTERISRTNWSPGRCAIGANSSGVCFGYSAGSLVGSSHRPWPQRISHWVPLEVMITSASGATDETIRESRSCGINIAGPVAQSSGVVIRISPSLAVIVPISTSTLAYSGLIALELIAFPTVASAAFSFPAFNANSVPPCWVTLRETVFFFFSFVIVIFPLLGYLNSHQNAEGEAECFGYNSH